MSEDTQPVTEDQIPLEPGEVIEPSTAPELEEPVEDNAQPEGGEAPVADEEPVEPAEVPEEEVDDEEVADEIVIRHAVKHFTGEHVTLGDGVAEALANDPSSVETIYLPSLGKQAPVSEFTYVADGSQVGK